MGQCCGKTTDEDDVQHIRESIEEYNRQQSENAVAHGTRSSGEVKINQDGSVNRVSPYNPGEVIQSETYNLDGSIHYTTINSATGVRYSYDIDTNGNVTNEHHTDQTVSKGDPDRHK